MTTSTRKMLADNMRCFDVVSDAGGRYWLNGTLFGMDISARSEERIRCGMIYLAELIDPVESHLADSGKMVDRDALLALADEMDDLAEAWGGKYPTNRVAAYARSIREACGAPPDGR